MMATAAEEAVEPTREPNCVPGETRIDAPGLRHDWRPTRLVGDVLLECSWTCPRCGIKDVTL